MSCCSYQVSKLLQLFAAREIADKIASTEPRVIINMLNPGLCRTELSRNATGATRIQLMVMKRLLGRTAEEGSRTLVHATTAPESHGVYLHDCKLQKYVYTMKELIGQRTDSLIATVCQSSLLALMVKKHRRKSGGSWPRSSRLSSLG